MEEREMATQKDAELLVLLLRWATEMGAEAAYAEIFSEGFQKEEASLSNPAVGKLLTYGEAVGTFVKHGLLDRALVNDFWLSSAVWDRLGSAVLKGREEMGEPRLFENFEALAKGTNQ
jgi:hypothetical protein